MSTAPLLGGMTSALATASFSPDDNTLSVAADDAKIRLFTTGAPYPSIAQLVNAPAAGTAPAGALNLERLGCNGQSAPSAFSAEGPSTFSPDGSLYAVACRSFSGNLIHGALDVWGARSGTELPHWPVATKGDFPTGLAFSPDNKTIVATGNVDHSGQGNVQLWDVITGRMLPKQPPTQTGDVGAVTVSPDNRTIAWSSNDQVFVWDVAHGTQRNVLSPSRDVTALALSPDNTKLAAASPQGVSVWDLDTATQIGPSLTAPDAEQALAASAATTLTFSTAGTTLTEVVQPYSTSTLRATDPPSAVSWTIQTDTWINDACAIAHRNLTSSEWKHYADTAPYQPQCPRLPV
jgi:WD40 repeat protein